MSALFSPPTTAWPERLEAKANARRQVLQEICEAFWVIESTD